MLRRKSDIPWTSLLALILIVLAVFNFHPPVIMAILGLPFVLIAPGYALMETIFPESGPRGIERFLFVIALSLAVIILSGLVLNFTPWGITPNSWLAILAVFTLIINFIALWRRREISTSETKPEHFYLPPRQVLILCAAGVLTSLAFGMSLAPRTAVNVQGYTSLWISPDQGTQPEAYVIGVHSQELTTINYDLIVKYNGQTEQEWRDITLAPGGQWSQNVPLPTGGGVLEALLYRSDNPGAVYRRVSMVIK